MNEKHDGWAKFINVNSMREVGKYHYFKDGSSLCGKYILMKVGEIFNHVKESEACRKCLKQKEVSDGE